MEKRFLFELLSERINHRDKIHKLENITKVISADDNKTLQLLKVYTKIIKKLCYRSIK